MKDTNRESKPRIVLQITCSVEFVDTPKERERMEKRFNAIQAFAERRGFATHATENNAL